MMNQIRLITGLSPSLVEHSNSLHRSIDFNNITLFTPQLDLTPFEVGLDPLHSPLLWVSQLVSFPPLIDMLKFGG